MNSVDTWRTALISFPAPQGLLSTPCWHPDDEYRVRLDNISGQTRTLREWLLFDGWVTVPESPIYGEGFQMLAQTGGVWGRPEAIGRCPDASVYRISEDQGYHTVHNLLMFKRDHTWWLLGFTACHRFGGEFRLYPDGRLQILLNTESLPLAAGAHWDSEPLFVACGPEKSALLQRYANQITRAHPALPREARVTGWCSWYHYYADVSAEAIEENLQQMQQSFPDLHYVQIDDGYQAAMGDWLLPSARFAGGLPPLLTAIRAAGREPALWVAPFIAEPGSQIFRDHPDWFVKDERGSPLPAEKVTYGGWRCTPWYVLDATQPCVQEHLQRLFRCLREEYGIRYFKLDANFWGAIHGAVHADRQATRIQAYRLGMQAILAGAGSDSFLLGCNAPLWPSLGLVHGMRVADDTERQAGRFTQIAHEVLSRSWQADRLWMLDPDCLCLRDLPTQHTTPAAYRVHQVTQIACGGMLLLGDRLADLSAFDRAGIERLLALVKAEVPPAQFDELLEYGKVPWLDGEIHCLFNWQPSARALRCPPGCSNYLTGELMDGEYWLAGGDAMAVWMPAPGMDLDYCS